MSFLRWSERRIRVRRSTPQVVGRPFRFGDFRADSVVESQNLQVVGRSLATVGQFIPFAVATKGAARGVNRVVFDPGLRNGVSDDAVGMEWVARVVDLLHRGIIADLLQSGSRVEHLEASLEVRVSGR